MDDALDRCSTSGAFHWLLLLYTGMSWACDAMEVRGRPHLWLLEGCCC